MSYVFSPHLYIRRFDREGHSHLFTLDARYADIFVAQTSVESPAGLGGGLTRVGIWRRVYIRVFSKQGNRGAAPRYSQRAPSYRNADWTCQTWICTYMLLYNIHYFSKRSFLRENIPTPPPDNVSDPQITYNYSKNIPIRIGVSQTESTC